MKKTICAIISLSMMFLFSAPVFAVNGPDTWTGDIDGNFSTAGNWTGTNTPPISGDSWIFDASAEPGGLNNDLAAGISVAGITFSSGAGTYSLNGNSIALTGTFTDNSGGYQTIYLDTVMAATRTFDIADGYVDFAGAISGAGGLVKTGNDTLVLYGDNSYTGLTTVSAGTLWAGSNTALGTVDNGTIVASDATLHLNNATITGEALTIGGIGVGGAGALNGYGTFDGPVLLGSPASVGADTSTDLYISGVISGAAGADLTIVGPGIVNLQGANDYAGDTIVNNGAYLNVYNASSLGTTAGKTTVNNGGNLTLYTVTITGETLELTGSGSGTGALRSFGLSFWDGVVTLTGDVAIYTDNANELTISGVIGGSGGLVKEGDGWIFLSGANDYTGNTTISGGVLALLASGSIPDASAVSVASGASLATRGNSETIGSLAGAGTVTNGNAADVVLTCGGNGASTEFSGTLEDGGGGGILGLVKTGAGTLILSGANTYTGKTTISGGTLSISAETGLGGNPAAPALDTLKLDGGTLQTTATFTINDANRWITLGASDGTINTNSGTTLTLDIGISGAGDLAKSGSGTLILNNIIGSDYTGTTTINAGTLQVGNGGTSGNFGTGAIINNSALVFNRSNDTGMINNGISGTGTLSVTAGNLQLRGLGTNTYTGTTNISSGATLTFGASSSGPASSAFTVTGTLALDGWNVTIGSLAGSGAVTDFINTGSLTAGGDNTSTTFSGVMSGITTSFTKAGTGTMTLTGANTYTGDTTISAGTLKLGNADTLDTANVINNATLDVGTYTLDATGTYDQAGKLKLTVNSASDYGNITSAGASTVSAGSTIDVNVGGYLANNTTLDIITGGSVAYDASTVINPLGNPHYSFTASNSGTVLTLTVNRTSNGFAAAATNANTRAVGTVLDNITNPTSDMTTVLNALDGLSNTQIQSVLNSMLPDYSGAVLQVSQHTLDQLTDAILGHQTSLRSSPTGVSTGSDMFKGLDIWAQGYGSYLHQDPRELSQGYNASIWGTALGFDIPAISDIRVGTCFGFAQDYIRGKDNSNRTDVNAYQWTVYGEYSKDALYIDLSGAFALNTYDGSRQVNAGPGINRTASSDYNGQQYQIYVESGYTLGYKKLNITPLASFQYQHLHLDKYTETGAGALNLTVKSQDYDLAQTGLGVKLDYPMDTKYGTLLPEVRVKWLYDWVGDAQSSTSTFTGGGASFATNGFTPAQSSWDFGTKLTLFTKNSWTMAANYDFELKEDYYGHYGYANAKYSF